ncbi:DHA1 family multidrug resistance protein-like MFS transporter [Alkalicoccobacillus murimartini]|uniref:DHA1 family multidrug resistance protein-like MFS transporter n=2 Tax=Alkalicoccobacillus murimartini TaxID=171685 RepID=A0ABT9YF42_9BACI|nr:DHA1 family multidrug resistance protein-like MFS transporter [Alkalicoccobacillus murimartini]
MIMPFLPLYLKELGMEDPAEISLWAGIIFGANFLTAFIFSPFWGRLADKHGRKMMILRSGFGMAIVISLTGLATGPISLLFLRLLNGVISGFIPAAIGLVSTNTPKQHTGQALGILQSGTVAGAIGGPLIGGLMSQAFGYRMIFFVTGAFILVAAIGVMLFVKEDFTPAKEVKTKTSTIQEFKEITARKPVFSIYAVILMIQFAIMGVNPLLSLYVEELSPAANVSLYAGIVVSVTGFANFMTSAWLGRVSDRKGAHNTLVYSLLGVAIFTIPQVFVTDIWQLIVLRFFVGLCLGGLLPAANTLIRMHAPTGMESRTYGFSNSAMYLGSMIGPILGGWVVSLYGVRGLLLITSLILICNVLLVRYKVMQPAEQTFRKQNQHEPN